MAVIGIERLIYCVEDVQKCTDFFEDFGLRILQQDGATTHFRLPDNSQVHIRPLASHPVPGSLITGQGVHELVWGVDTGENLRRLVARVAADRTVHCCDEGIHHFVADGGIPMGLRHWPEKRQVFAPAEPVNSPGNVQRMNVHRR